MRERLEDVGGEVAVDSSARGTRLRVSLPLRGGEGLRKGSAA
jgi:signal transduction histidine kinase